MAGRRRHVIWQHKHEATIAARAAATAIAILVRGGMTVAEVAAMWGMTQRGARKLLESMSSRDGVPLYEDHDGRWKILLDWPW